jgi:hypothetical protein
MFKKFIFLVSLVLFRMLAIAHPDTLTIPVFRQYFHDKINAEQMACDRADGKSDNLMRIGNNEEVNYRISDILFRKIDDLQVWVEVNENIDKNNDKIRLLGYIEQELRLFRQAWKRREIAPSEFPAVIDNFILMVKAQDKGTPLVDFIRDKSYIVARINTLAFADHPGFKEAEKMVYFKYCTIHPDVILSTIRPFVKEPFADSLIVIACKFNPAQLYSYAQSVNTPEGKLIHQNTNPLVITVSTLSQTNNALMYFPFLDDIISGKKTVDGIRKFVGDGEESFDSVGYYKLLVQTETEYFRRMSSPAKDTPIAMFGSNGLREVLKDRAIRHFIT